MKRIKVHIEGESPARKAGLKIAQAEKEGFKCTGCTAPQRFSKYVMAHWGDMLVHTCQTCGTVHKMKEGKIAQISGPTKTIKRVRIPPPSVDPRVPQWRVYALLNAAGKPPSFRAVTGYHATLDAANAEAWEYANRAEAYSRPKREALHRSLLRRAEFPLLSQVETNGMLVGFGEVTQYGSRKLGLESVHFFSLRDPRGNETTVLIRDADFAQIIEGWELKEVKR